MKSCKECYSSDNRITPLLHPVECLKQHEQYICGTCGRCICIQHDPKRHLQRWNFPFRSFEIAMLYLRSANYTSKSSCAIYEITNHGRNSYKIFKDDQDVEAYKKSHSKSQMVLKYQEDHFQEYPHTQIRKLSDEEIDTYLQERS